MRSISRAPLTLVLAVVLLAGLAPVAASAATITMPTAEAIAKAERDAHTLTNRKRTDRGLIALRWDTRLAELARERAQYMATTGTFSHTQDGQSVFDMMTDQDITWYGGGEILAWNTVADLAYSTGFAVKGWMESPPHKAILLSDGFNYVGFGLAVSATGQRYWAGVYMKGPDRTTAWAKMGSVTKTVIDGTRIKVKVTWSGGDQRLQVLTSGFRYFQMQKRRDGGAWYTYDTTTATSLSRSWYRGHVYEFRVRARDKAGLWSPWVSTTIKT